MSLIKYRTMGLRFMHRYQRHQKRATNDYSDTVPLPHTPPTTNTGDHKLFNVVTLCTNFNVINSAILTVCSTGFRAIF